MAPLPYMRLYVSDYLADAAHLTTEEHGAYLLLIMTYWQRGKALPADRSRLARIARLSDERWTDVERTLSEFFTVDGDCWRHGRIEAELEKVCDKSTKAKLAGTASAEAKKAAGAQRTLNAGSTDAEQTLNHTDTDTDTEEERENARALEPAHWAEVRGILADHLPDLDEWEVNFLGSIQSKRKLTKAQLASLGTIGKKTRDKAATGTPPTYPSVKRGTPAFEAWIGYYRAKNGGRATFHEGRDMLTVPSEFPPQEQAA